MNRAQAFIHLFVAWILMLQFEYYLFICLCEQKWGESKFLNSDPKTSNTENKQIVRFCKVEKIGADHENFYLKLENFDAWSLYGKFFLAKTLSRNPSYNFSFVIVNTSYILRVPPCRVQTNAARSHRIPFSFTWVKNIINRL